MLQDLDFNSLEGNCHQSITCHYNFDEMGEGNKEIYCENTDLYDVFVGTLRSKVSMNSTLPFIPNIECQKSDTSTVKKGGVVNSDRVIYGYSLITIICTIIISIIS